MDKKSDYALRSDLKKLKKRLNEVMAEFSYLNDANFILQNIQDLSVLKSALQNYSGKIKAIIGDFLNDRGLMKVAQDSFDDSIKKINRYLKSNPVVFDDAERENLIKGALDSVAKNDYRVIESISNSLSTKLSHFKLIHDSIVKKAEQRMFGEKFISLLKRSSPEKKTLDAYWKALTKRYGSTDTVTYSNGANFPLTSYIDMRARTNSEVVSSAVNEAISLSSSIYFGKISSHNSQDSCILWEGKIIFWSDVFKKAFMQEYPKLANLVADWSTLDDVRNDMTHMFKPNCRHTITPYPLNFFDYNEMVAEIKANRMPVIRIDIVKAANRRMLKKAV